jgi:type I restriction enzyme S subunit
MSNRVLLESIVAKIGNGIDAEQIDQPSDGMLPISRIETIWDGVIDFERVKYAQVTKAEIDKYALQSGDILFSHINSPTHIGKTAIYRSDQTLIHGINLLLIRVDQKKCYPEYLNYYFKSKNVRALFRARCKKAVNQASLNQPDILELEVPLPSLTEQKRIASLLRRADRLRQLRRTAHDLGDALLQSVFLEMFGDIKTNSKNWDMCIIDDVVEFSQYGTSEKSNSENRGYPVLGMANITYEGRIDLEKLSYVELSDKEFAGLKLERGDVIFNRTNSTELVGKTAYWNYDFDAVIASYLVKLKLKKEMLPEFFVAMLNMLHYKNMFQERCKKAVGQSNISPTLLKEFPIFVPPLSLQEEFAGVVARVESLRGRMGESERQVEGLFESLLNQSFGGKL